MNNASSSIEGLNTLRMNINQGLSIFINPFKTSLQLPSIILKHPVRRIGYISLEREAKVLQKELTTKSFEI